MPNVRFGRTFGSVRFGFCRTGLGFGRSLNEMLYQIFITQWKYPARHDWTETVKKDLQYLDIPVKIEYIKSFKKEQFREIVKRQVKKRAFQYLLELKNSHSKMKDIEYEDWKQQSYLRSNRVTTSQARNIYKYRVRMSNLKCNRKRSHADLSCDLCNLALDEDRHLLQCAVIKEKSVNIRNNRLSKYEDIFGSDVDKMVSTVNLLEEALSIREKLIQEKITQ